MRSTGNRSTELIALAALRDWRLSGWRRHVPLPGRPDFAWYRLGVVLFVDGCFWHGCPRHYRAPKNNAAFWRHKIDTNRARDHRVTRQLRRLGWKVIRVWECQIQSQAFKTRLHQALGRTPD